MTIVPKTMVLLEQLPQEVNSKMQATHLTSMLLKHNNNKQQNQRSLRVSNQTQACLWAMMVDSKANNSEQQLHNKTKVIHLVTSNRIASKQQTKDMAIKDIISNKMVITNNNKTNSNSNSLEPNNNMDSSKITKIKISANSIPNNNNNQITILALIINSKTQIISVHSSNSLGSITTKIINSSSNSNSKDLIISNSNSPLSNKTPIKVRRLICFEIFCLI
jgi:hypothetical protein